MPVRLKPPTPESLLPVPGIALGTAAAKIKNWMRDDVVLIVAEPGATAMRVFTENRFCAAPVQLCRAHLRAELEGRLDVRALVINAGNANAGTGAVRLDAAGATCTSAAHLVGSTAEHVVAFSTGGPMDP